MVTGCGDKRSHESTPRGKRTLSWAIWSESGRDCKCDEEVEGAADDDMRDVDAVAAVFDAILEEELYQR